MASSVDIKTRARPRRTSTRISDPLGGDGIGNSNGTSDDQDGHSGDEDVVETAVSVIVHSPTVENKDKTKLEEDEDRHHEVGEEEVGGEGIDNEEDDGDSHVEDGDDRDSQDNFFVLGVGYFIRVEEGFRFHGCGFC